MMRHNTYHDWENGGIEKMIHLMAYDDVTISPYYGNMHNLIELKITKPWANFLFSSKMSQRDMPPPLG